MERCWLFLVLLLMVIRGLISTIPPGFPCEKIPNFCDRVECIPADNCPNGEIMGGGGNCGCCEICVTYAELGETCTTDDRNGPYKLPVQLLPLSYKFELSCHPGLRCEGSPKTCTKYVNNNSKYTKDCLYRQTQYTNNDWEVEPECDFYGDYGDLRKKGRDTPRSFCVNKTGSSIFGRIPTGFVNTTCACSRSVDELKTAGNLLAANIRCDEMGDFTTLQCWRNICFCVDPYTKEMTSPAIPIAGIEALSCYNKTLYNVTYYSPCQREIFKMGGFIEELKNKGVTGILLQLPECDLDGTYSPVQYNGNMQYCATRDGIQIGSFVNYDKPKLDMDCNCARDNYYPEGLPNSYRFQDCNQYGDYNPSYMVGNDFYCLDSDGQQSSDESSFSDKTPIACPTN